MSKDPSTLQTSRLAEWTDLDNPPTQSRPTNHIQEEASILDRLPIGICLISGSERSGFQLIRGNTTLERMLGLKNPLLPQENDPDFMQISMEPAFLRSIERASSDHHSEPRFIWRTDINGLRRILDCSIQMLDSTSHTYLLTIADRTEDNLSEQKLLHDVFHDRLTQLPNSAMFVLRASEWLESRRTRDMGAVIMVNINRFQIINESLGHRIGDQLLIKVAERLTRLMPHDTIIARMGGDEFAILLPFIPPEDEGVSLANQIHEELSQRLEIENQDLRITISIGIALTCVQMSSAEDLVKNASIAMHRAKREGLGRTVVYHHDLKAHAKSRFEFEGDLRRALERGELSLHYQPIYSLATEEITGFEALCRWHHPERGSVSPVDFIAIAETSGLIIPLGRWAIAEACRQLSEWSRTFPKATGLSVNVNVSGLQISGDNMGIVVKDALIASGLAGHRLTLEITESALMTNADLAADLLLDLKSYGVCLALDDFGTGYSSLNYLSRFPIDTIKIDRSFISKLDSTQDDVKIVHIITQLAKSLGISAVAEGIETIEHLDRLKQIGCHYGQGYYFSRPLPVQEVEQKLFL